MGGLSCSQGDLRGGGLSGEAKEKNTDEIMKKYSISINIIVWKYDAIQKFEEKINQATWAKYDQCNRNQIIFNVS